MLYNQDIPRICTALAEWGACMVYLYLIKREKLRRPSFWYISLAVMAVQIAFLELTGDLPVAFWLTCMAIAVAIMYVFLLMGGELSALGAGYCGARAFLLAEFAASLEWQVFAFMRSIGYGSVWIQVIFVIIIYGGCFWIAAYLERPSLTDDYLNQLTIREVLAAAGIAAAIFAFSNLSYLYSNLPFTSSRMADIFSIRTLVDFGGIAVLFAYQSRICDYMAERELAAMNAVLKSQYDQYRNYQDSLDLIHIKYHDLKHQIALLKSEAGSRKSVEYLEKMEKEIKIYEAQNKTGNKVLDAVLTSKSLYCQNNGIGLTCVADGSALNFMEDMDISALFGNILDNAIESVQKLNEQEKRLIHLSVAKQKQFLRIRCENYCEEQLKFENGMPVTTKKDRRFHGFGMKSIKSTAAKYGGSVTTDLKKNWFELRILIPLS